MQPEFTASGPTGMDIRERLIGRALTNPDFRAQLFADPTAAASSMGLTLTPQQVARIQSVDSAAVDELAARFDAAVGSSFSGSMTLEGASSIW